MTKSTTTCAIVLAVSALAIGAVGCSPEPLSQIPTADAAAGAAIDAAESAPASWLEGARRHIEQREYRASAGPAGLQAPNRNHGLRTYFEPEGIRVLDRTATDATELLSLRLETLGRGEETIPVGPGEVTHVDARVEIARDTIVEWYVNAASGLEQGFTVTERPAGVGPVVLELALSGAEATQVGSDRLRLAAHTGRHLDYGKLVAFDAHGASLPVALIAASAQRIQLRVDDADAVYPILIDPIFTAVYDTLVHSNQAQARLGASVSSAGDVDGDGYDDLIVGAPQYDTGLLDAGAAFVFLGGASGVASGDLAVAATQLTSNQSFASLGTSVAGAGDVNDDGYDDVIVGAPDYDRNVNSGGAAFVFLGGPAGIASATVASAATKISLDLPSQILGSSVAGAGDVNGDGYDDVIVADDQRFTVGPFAGAAFVFHGSATGVANATPATAATKIESDQAAAFLGSSVAGAGDVNDDGYDDVIVGARQYDTGVTDTDEGIAQVFLGSAAGIVLGSKAQLESDLPDAFLGTSVSGAGDVNGDGYDDVVVGAPGYDLGLMVGGGAVFVFEGSASGIASGGPANAASQLDAVENTALGQTVSSAGDVNSDGYADLILGQETLTGRKALVHLGGASGVAQTAVNELQPTPLVESVSDAGDVNGDGYDDVILGAPEWSGAQSIEGAAFVYLGGTPSAGITIVTPISVVTTSEWNAPPPEAKKENLIDGSGLSGTGPVQTRTHDNNGNALTMWHAGQVDGGLGGPTGAPPQVDAQALVFDLGATLDLEGTFIWNHNQSNQSGVTERGVKDLEILVSPDSDPLTATFTSVGTFHLAESRGRPDEPSQRRDFDGRNTRLVRFEIASAHSGLANDWVGLSEVRFVAPRVAIEWVPVGDPGNACDVLTAGCFGSVDAPFRIAKYEITNAQYAEFLNSVAATDPNGLYDDSMGTDDVMNTIWVGGITRSGSPGSYSYAPIAGKEDWPVNFVNFWDAARFVNWLENGQPTGAQDATTTEDGTYTLSPAAIAANSVTRNPGATHFIPTEDEWYKAAFYDPGTTSYSDYPAGSNAQTVCSAVGAVANTANCFSAVGGGLLADVGSYTASPSPYGTFDQGGNLAEWNETASGGSRGLRGGHKEIFPTLLAAEVSSTFRFATASQEGSLANLAGMRVASVPEPGVGLLGGSCLMMLAWLRRSRARRLGRTP